MSLHRLGDWYRGLSRGQRAIVLVAILAFVSVVARRDFTIEGISIALLAGALQVAIYSAILAVVLRIFGRFRR